MSLPQSNLIRRSEVGEMRPSQLLSTFGVGSLIDLPNLSVLVLGLDDWRTDQSIEIGEERLLQSVQAILGAQVKRLLTPPQAPNAVGGQTNWFDDAHQVGVPVAPFPRWMVCSRCRLLAPLRSDLFAPSVKAYRPDKACYVHNCNMQGRPPIALPARFMVACPNGHLDDFPWVEFVHRGEDSCQGPLYMYEIGASGEAADVEIKCSACKQSRRMAEAFGKENEHNLPACRSRRPHLRDFDHDHCEVEHVRPILQGASNSWFAVSISTLWIPQAKDRLSQLIDDNWAVLEKATSPEVLAAFREIGQLKDFAKYSTEQVWRAIQKKREGGGEQEATADLKSPEWSVFSNPGSGRESRDFRLRSVEPPKDFERFFDKVVLVEKLREVRALVGFTRIESARDFDSAFELPASKRAPLSRRDPTWVPACETRGEGIFFQFSESAVQSWLGAVRHYSGEFEKGHRQWRESKNLDPESGYPGMRYILLHTFAHAIIRQLAVECGYTTASLAERVYSRSPMEGDPMAGVLVYTAAPDSEGTLGGLSALGRPRHLGRHIEQALQRMSLCASDPLCAEHKPTLDVTLHGAACHACSFLPETSCERGNKYLDRSVLVATVERADLGFFR